MLQNAFQSPNDYVDIGMELLTPEEFKCLMFAARHILGWQDRATNRQAVISLTMFERGYGDYAGTGLSRAAIVKALEQLTKSDLLVKLEETPDGQRWELPETPNWDYLRQRRDEQLEKNRQRTANARAQRRGQSHLPATVSPTNHEPVSGTNQQAVSGTDQPAVSETNHERLVAQTDSGMSDRLNQKHFQNQSLSFNTDSDSAEDSFEEKEREIAYTHDSTPVPFHIANGLGRRAAGQPSPLVQAIEAHPAYQAFARGWDGITPKVEPMYADQTLQSLKALEEAVSARTLTLADVEAVTRWKLSNPRIQGYRVNFVLADYPSYCAWKRAQKQASESNATDWKREAEKYGYQT